MAARRQEGERQLIFARAKQLDVVAIMRTVVGDHGVEVTLELGVVALFLQLERHIEVGHETAFLEALLVVRRGADVGFQVHVGICRGSHHPGRGHFNRLQIHRADLQSRAQLRFTDGVFLGLGQWRKKQQGERQSGKCAHDDFLVG